jgi:hypothetical protein
MHQLFFVLVFQEDLQLVKIRKEPRRACQDPAGNFGGFHRRDYIHWPAKILCHRQFALSSCTLLSTLIPQAHDVVRSFGDLFTIKVHECRDELLEFLEIRPFETFLTDARKMLLQILLTHSRGVEYSVTKVLFNPLLKPQSPAGAEVTSMFHSAGQVRSHILTSCLQSVQPPLQIP